MNGEKVELWIYFPLCTGTGKRMFMPVLKHAVEMKESSFDRARYTRREGSLCIARSADHAQCRLRAPCVVIGHARMQPRVPRTILSFCAPHLHAVQDEFSIQEVYHGTLFS